MKILKRKSNNFGRKIVARQLTCPKRKLFKTYSNTFKIGKSTFGKIFKFNGEYKKYKKRTDLCDKCVTADPVKK